MMMMMMMIRLHMLAFVRQIIRRGDRVDEGWPLPIGDGSG